MNRAEKATWIERELDKRLDLRKVPQAVMMVKADEEDREFLLNYFGNRRAYKTMQIIEDGTIQEKLVIYVNI